MTAVYRDVDILERPYKYFSASISGGEKACKSREILDLSRVVLVGWYQWSKAAKSANNKKDQRSFLY